MPNIREFLDTLPEMDYEGARTKCIEATDFEYFSRIEVRWANLSEEERDMIYVIGQGKYRGGAGDKECLFYLPKIVIRHVSGDAGVRDHRIPKRIPVESIYRVEVFNSGRVYSLE